MVKVGDKVKVILEDDDHPFMLGQILTVVELLDYGCIWAKDRDKTLGCLIPKEFKKVK